MALVQSCECDYTFNSLGVALEPELEELLRGFVGGESVYVVEVKWASFFSWVGFGFGFGP